MNKKAILSIIFFNLIFTINCSSKKNIQTPLTAQVSVISEEPRKTIEVRSIGYGKNESQAAYDAERKAFEIIFFRGIPNTGVEKPLIGIDENKAYSNSPQYLKDFFDSRYLSFIMSSFMASPPQKNKGLVTVVKDIKINLMSLKKDLENHHVIRSFGF